MVAVTVIDEGTGIEGIIFVVVLAAVVVVGVSVVGSCRTKLKEGY